MSAKMICPGCDAWNSSVLIAYQAGECCPYCGLSASAMAEIERIRQTRADEQLKEQLAEAIKAREAAESKAAKLEGQLDRVRRALEDPDG